MTLCMAKKYETAIRTGGRRHSGYSGKRKNGGTIAAVLAIVLVFAAGFLIGNTSSIPRLIGGTDKTASGDSSSVQSVSSSNSSSSPEAGSITLPQGLTTVAPPSEEVQALTVGSIENVTAANYIVIDRLSGEVILEKNSTGKIYPASTTKIMTAALALEHAKLGDSLTVTSTALGLLSGDALKIGLQRDEVVPVQDLLYATMLSSSCDAANVLADQLGGAGGFSGYVSEMVAMAKSIGCTGTYFVNPSGIYSSAHFSTAADMARMEAYACKKADFRKIVSAEEYIMTATNVHTKDGWATAQNANPIAELTTLLKDTNITAVTGAKTGTTTQGGYSLVCTAVTTGGRELVAVVSGLPYNKGQGITNRTPDMAAILAEGAKQADSAAATTLVTSGEELSSALAGGVESLIPQTMKLTAARSLALTTPTEGTALVNGDTAIFYTADAFSVQAVYYNDLESRLALANAGQEVTVGYLQISLGEENPVDTIPLVIRAR